MTIDPHLIGFAIAYLCVSSMLLAVLFTNNVITDGWLKVFGVILLTVFLGPIIAAFAVPLALLFKWANWLLDNTWLGVLKDVFRHRRMMAVIGQSQDAEKMRKGLKYYPAKNPIQRRWHEAMKERISELEMP